MFEALHSTMNSPYAALAAQWSPDVVIGRIVSDIDNPLMLILRMNMVIEKRGSQGTLIFWLSSSSLQDLICQVDGVSTRADRPV